MASNMLRIATRVANNVPAKEGALAVPEGQLLAHMQHFIAAKYAVEMAYRSFADRLRGPWRDAVVDHWHDHAKDERQSTYDLSMKVVGLGGDPIQTAVQIPPCVPNVAGFCKVLMSMELDAIEAGRKLIGMAGSATSLVVLAENTILLDTHHLDDLRRMCANLEIPL